MGSPGTGREHAVCPGASPRAAEQKQTSHLTGNCAHARAAGCIQDRSWVGSGGVVGSGQVVVKWVRLASGRARTFQDLEPRRTPLLGPLWVEEQVGVCYEPSTRSLARESWLLARAPQCELSSRPGHTLLDIGPQASLASPTCWVGSAPRSPALETTNISEPSRAPAPSSSQPPTPFGSQARTCCTCSRREP